MNRRIALAIVWTILGATHSWAQVADMIKPTEPILKRAPVNAEWSVQFFEDRAKVQDSVAKGNLDMAQDEAVKAEMMGPVSVTISKSGDTYHEVTVWGNGQIMDKWIVGDKQVYETPYTKGVARVVIPAAGQFSRKYSDYRRSDFEALEWVGKDNFAGVKDFGGRKVFVFGTDAAKRRLTPREMNDLVDPDGNKTAVELLKEHGAKMVGKPGLIAYLDVQTQLPVYFDDGEVVRVYKFSTSSPGNLTIPPRFITEIESWKKEVPPLRFARP